MDELNNSVETVETEVLVPKEDTNCGVTEIPNSKIIGIDATKAKAFAIGGACGAGAVIAWMKAIPAIKHIRERRAQRKAELLAQKAEETKK